MKTETARLERQVDAERDGDDLDRLAGRDQGRAHEHRHDLGIGDGGAQRRVLDQVEILAGDGRDDHRHGLRDHDQPQDAALREAERAGGVDLALAHGQDAAAHHFGDEARGVGRERHEQRHELRHQREAAAIVEAAQDRHVPRRERAGGDEGQQRAARRRARSPPARSGSRGRCAPAAPGPSARGRSAGRSGAGSRAGPAGSP